MYYDPIAYDHILGIPQDNYQDKTFNFYTDRALPNKLKFRVLK